LKQAFRLTALKQLHTLHRVPTFNESPTLPALDDPNLVYRDDLQTGDSPPAVDPNNPVWGVAGALLIWLASILAQAIIPLFFVIPFALHRGLNPSAPDFGKMTLDLAVTDRTAILLQVLSILPTHLLTLALLWAFVTRFGKRPFLASLGWGWFGSLRWWQSVGLGVALFIAATTLAKLLGAEKPTQLEQLINSSIGTRYAIAALAVFTAPFVEEFIYRGVLYSALQRAIGVNAAVFLVLGLFTMIHVPQYWPNIGVISAVALLSVVLTIVRAYSGRLLPCVVIHMSFNAVQALILIAEPYVQRLLPSAESGVPGASMFLPFIHLFF
jgi:membrane protease YdiL (CAAX protease family)